MQKNLNIGLILEVREIQNKAHGLFKASLTYLTIYCYKENTSFPVVRLIYLTIKRINVKIDLILVFEEATFSATLRALLLTK